MKLTDIHSAYFVGIGGIGMSAIARYFNALGIRVAGYDKVRSALCEALESEGMDIVYRDDADAIASWFLDTPMQHALVVYTPAIPRKHPGLNFLQQGGYEVLKRAEVLGVITAGKTCVAIAGTHGKTSTSALVAHMLTQGGVPCNAFLGGIASNFNSNVVIAADSDIVVVEADEYDRSFLKLSPNVAVITSVEADHLDIYGNGASLKAAFNEFAALLPEGGKLFCRKGIEMEVIAETYTYGIDPEADITASDVEVRDGYFTFEAADFGESLGRMTWSFPGRHNIENALAAIGIALHFGLDKAQIAEGLATFTGVKRRFETHIRRPDCVYIDDYAHHPTELKACIGSARELYPNKRLTGVFQPHLYSRTRDFGDDFARSLEDLNELLLLEIYPAREEPIPGIDGDWLLNKVQLVNKKLCSKDKLVNEVLRLAPEVLLTMGAGDIDAFIEPLKNALQDEKDE